MIRHESEQLTETADAHGFQVPLVDALMELSRVAWRRKGFVMLGVILGLGMGVAYYYLQPPMFKSRAQLLVERKRSRVLPIPGVDPQMAAFQDSLGSHEALIKSPLIVERALQDDQLRQQLGIASDAESQKEAVSEVSSNITVSRDAKNAVDRFSALFNVAYECDNAVNAKDVVDAIIKAYDEYLNDAHRADSDDVRQLYLTWRDDIQDQLAAKRSEYTKLLATAKPMHWVDEKGINLSEKRVADIFAQRLEHLVRLAIITERLDELETARKAGVSNQVMMRTIASWKDDASIEATDRADQLFELMLEEQTLLRRFGKDHPEVRSIRQRMAITARQAVGSEVDESDVHLLDPVEVVISSLKQDKAITEGLARSLQELIDEEHANALEAHAVTNSIAQLKADKEAMTAIQSEVVTQLQELDVVRKSDVLDAHLLSRPDVGKLVIRHHPVAITALSLVLGLMIGGVFVLIAEWSNLSFRTPEQVTQRLQLPVLGNVRYRRTTSVERKMAAKVGCDVSLIARYDPDSADAEVFRTIRNVLFYSERAKNVQTLQITSPSEGDGKSTLAANLAITIARSGRKVAVVDTDFRKPSLHKYFGVSVQVGLPAVLEGTGSLFDAVQDVGVENLRLLPCGPPPANPGELFHRAEFKELVKELREEFDYVIFDSSPLLAASDPSAVAAQSDAVLLAICNSKDASAKAAWAVRMLDTVDANVIGVVPRGNSKNPHAGGFGDSEHKNLYTYEGADRAWQKSGVTGENGHDVNRPAESVGTS